MTPEIKIKNPKLKKLLETSLYFKKMSFEEKKKLVNKINSSSARRQELIYLPFFEEKNKIEKTKVKERNEKFIFLINKIKDIDKQIKINLSKSVEEKNRSEEEEKEQNLLNQLNNL